MKFQLTSNGAAAVIKGKSCKGRNVILQVQSQSSGANNTHVYVSNDLGALNAATVVVTTGPFGGAILSEGVDVIDPFGGSAFLIIPNVTEALYARALIASAAGAVVAGTIRLEVQLWERGDDVGNG